MKKGVSEIYQRIERILSGLERYEPNGTFVKLSDVRAVLSVFAEEEEQAAIETRKEFHREENRRPKCGSYLTTKLESGMVCQWCSATWQPLPEAPKED